ncbi:MAG: hydrogenase maturation nickel metallochaperone HypA, partial [Firmicutes bacterium]|nr:hydrogenase maturation nickel metallochaperone HypA [Bacillota bacterium]
MHELSLAVPIAEAVEREAGGRPVQAVVLAVGALSGVVPEALELALTVALAGTSAAGARVEWHRVPG